MLESNDPRFTETLSGLHSPAILTLDENQNIEDFNEAAGDLLGLGSDGSGSPVVEALVLAARRASHAGRLGDRTFRVEIDRFDPPRTLVCRLERRNNGARSSGFWLTVEEAELAGGRVVQLAAASRLRSIAHLARALGHDMRAPLSTIIHGIRLLDRGMQAGRAALSEEERKQFLERMRQEIDSLQKLMTLFLSQTLLPGESDEIFDLRPLLEELRDLSQPHLQKERITLQLELPSRPVKLEARPQLIKDALLALLVNAIQASDSGSTIGLQVRVDAAQAQIRICDERAGISADVAEAVGQNSPSKRSRHDSLGLYVAREVAVFSGGNLSQESQTGSGACFVMELPVIQD